MKAGIAGAGLLGRLLAWKLVQSGWNVTLFDRDAVSAKLSCAMSAAGMLAPISEVENSDSTIYELGLRSLTVWPMILKRLDHPVYFQQAGSLLTAHPQDTGELNHYSKRIMQKLARYNQSFNTLNHASISELEPELTHISTGLYFPIEGQLDNRELMKALHTSLFNRGVQWITKAIVLDVKPGIIHLKNESKKFDLVFDCRGLGAQSSFPNLRGIRGEVIELHAPDVNITRPVRLLHPRYRLYIVPRPKHRYLIGASEIESNDMTSISVRSTLELLSAAYSLHPGFAEARIINTTVNCRPALPDNLPQIKSESGFIAINGLYRHGFLIAPALLEKVEKLYG